MCWTLDSQGIGIFPQCLHHALRQGRQLIGGVVETVLQLEHALRQRGDRIVEAGADPADRGVQLGDLGAVLLVDPLFHREHAVGDLVLGEVHSLQQRGGLLGELAPALSAGGAVAVRVAVADGAVGGEGVFAFSSEGSPKDAVVSFWLEASADRAWAEALAARLALHLQVSASAR